MARSLTVTKWKSEPGEHYGTPKEVYGFRTRKTGGAPLEVAREFLRANRELLGISGALETLRHQRTATSLGARHVIFQQVHADRRVHRAYVTVHVGNDGAVYFVKNRAAPVEHLPRLSKFEVSRRAAVARARRSVRAKGKIAVRGVEEMWFPRGKRLLPAIRVRLRRSRPAQDWIIYVHARTGKTLSRYDNLAALTGKGRVFDPSPVTALGGHASLLTKKGNFRKPPAAAYRDVTLHGLSKGGRLDGRRVTTNATPAQRRIRRSNRDFRLASTERGFEEVMVYFHVDSVLRYLERLGFRGKRAIFHDPVRVNVNGTRQDNSWYSPTDRLLTFGVGAIDDAEDGETIVHELGHAIQDAIIPDFGQSDEAAAMGEGFGDYLAASFFADRKPGRYRGAVMTWDGLLLGLEEGSDPPALRHVDERWTYSDFNPKDGEHENGKIWSATLWDIRASLGAQEADRIIVESHFQQDGFTTFARGGRAIVDADRNLNDGENRAALERILKKRRIGPL